MEGLIGRMTDYLSKSFTEVEPLLASLLWLINYIMFPEKAHYIALCAVVGAAMLDIFTKSYSIIKKYGGYRRAIELKKLFSKTLWTGTETKIISYLTISILTGLSYRVIYLKEAGVIIASFVYSVMFMREFQSNIENLIEAGADLHWLLLFSKKKNKDLMKFYEQEQASEKMTEEEELIEDYEQRI